MRKMLWCNAKVERHIPLRDKNLHGISHNTLLLRYESICLNTFHGHIQPSLCIHMGIREFLYSLDIFYKTFSYVDECIYIYVQTITRSKRHTPLHTMMMQSLVIHPCTLCCERPLGTSMGAYPSNFPKT